MNSKENLIKPSENSGFLAHRSHRRLFLGLLVLAPLGFFDAGYLTVEHFLNQAPPCSLVSGCELVTTSSYSVIFGMPTALMGALYYLAIILALILYLDLRRDWIIKWTARFTTLGFLFSLWLVYLQLFVIKAICQYCMLSALSSTGLFVIGVLVLRSHRRLEQLNANN
jgi:uncharacterized membrane protein